MAHSGSRNYKAPPAFAEGQDYNDWKLDIELWQEFTSLEKKKQGTAFLLELEPGKVKDAVRSLGKEVLVAEDGMNQIITHLDKIYKEDAAQLSYRVYSKFEKYSRPDSMSLQSYISEFEKLLADLKKQKITLPQEVLAYRFLNSANLPVEKTDLALATVKALTYEEMCKTIGKIFSVRSNVCGSNMADDHELSVKMEPEECHYVNNSRRGGGTICGRPHGHEERSYHPYRKSTATYSGCFVCGEKDHSARMCKMRKDIRQKTNEEMRFTTDVYDQYLTHGVSSEFEEVQVIPQMETDDTVCMTFMVIGDKSEENCLVNRQPSLGSLVFDTLACAVIDSGCTKTVVGRNWITAYKDTLEEEEQKMMTTQRSTTPFRFGDGIEVMSHEKVKIPGCIGKSKVLIEANVVDKDLPLLLSKESMKKAGAILDFKNDRMLFNNQAIDLYETRSKHYCVPLCIKRRLFIGPCDKRPRLVLNVTEETLFRSSYDEIRQKIEGLHKQLSHPQKDDFKSLLKEKGLNRNDFMKAIDEVTGSCLTCKMYKSENVSTQQEQFEAKRKSFRSKTNDNESIGNREIERLNSLKWLSPGHFLERVPMKREKSQNVKRERVSRSKNGNNFGFTVGNYVQDEKEKKRFKIMHRKIPAIPKNGCVVWGNG